MARLSELCSADLELVSAGSAAGLVAAEFPTLVVPRVSLGTAEMAKLVVSALAAGPVTVEVSIMDSANVVSELEREVAASDCKIYN